MTTSYQRGDRVDIGAASPIILGGRKGSNGFRWTWVMEHSGEAGEVYWPTAEEAIAHARKIMDLPECRHGERGWCPDCHDVER